MNTLEAIAVATIVVLSISMTHAQNATPVYTLGVPTVFGSGCLLGSVVVMPSLDAQSISILLSDYGATTTGHQRRVRKTCDFVIPVDARPGFAVGFFQADFRGYVYVPNDPSAKATLTNEYFFPGQPSLKVKKEYPSGTDEDIFDSQSIDFESVIWSPCGGSTNFRLNSNVLAVKPSGLDDDTMILIDSMDAILSGEIQVYVTTLQCNETVSIGAGIP